MFSWFLDHLQVLLNSITHYRWPRASYFPTRWTSWFAIYIVLKLVNIWNDLYIPRHISVKRRLTVTESLATYWWFLRRLPQRWQLIYAVTYIATIDCNQSFFSRRRYGPPITLATHVERANHKRYPHWLLKSMRVIADPLNLMTFCVGYEQSSTNSRFCPAARPSLDIKLLITLQGLDLLGFHRVSVLVQTNRQCALPTKALHISDCS